MMSTLYPFKPTFADIIPARQGRSKKELHPVVEHDGRVWVAYYEGRGERVFASAYNEVLKSLKSRWCS
jgi:hypothetical protein